MEMLDHLMLGFSVASLPMNLAFCFLGVLLGTVIGILPGIGPLATISMLLPLTFGMSPVTSLIMLSGIFYGAQYGGSTTAILVNLPGEASSTVTMIDGYQMARRGRAGPALAVAAIGSFFAGTVTTMLIAVVAVPLTAVALSFGPAEYCALMVVGLVSSIALASGSVIKAIGMICCGLLLGLTGVDIYSSQQRFTFGMLPLMDGIDFVALAVGIFGFAEILRNLESGTSSRPLVGKITSLMPTRDDWRRIAGPILRGTAIGGFLGILPGGGALLSAFVSYNIEKKVSPNSAEFGHGAIEGVAAPESANNAAAQTSFIPMLSLGLPASPIMALMIGALTIHGITPGPNVISRDPALFWGLIASMWIGNAMLLVLNLPLIGIWVKLLQVPYRLLYPIIIGLCCIGVYSVSNAPFNVYMTMFAGLLAYALTKFDLEWAPFILGFVLGPLFEHQLRRTMLITGGDASVFLTRPISAGLLIVAAALLVIIVLPMVRQSREQIFVEED